MMHWDLVYGRGKAASILWGPCFCTRWEGKEDRTSEGTDRFQMMRRNDQRCCMSEEDPSEAWITQRVRVHSYKTVSLLMDMIDK